MSSHDCYRIIVHMLRRKKIKIAAPKKFRIRDSLLVKNKE